MRLLGGARGARAPMGEERGGGILCRHAHSLFTNTNTQQQTMTGFRRAVFSHGVPPHIRIVIIIIIIIISCAGGRHNMPRPCKLTFDRFDPESGVLVTCDVGYLFANFSLPRPLCSRLWPDVRDRQTDVR